MDKVKIDLQKLEQDLRRCGWGAEEVGAIWHTLWETAPEISWIEPYDDRFPKMNEEEEEEEGIWVEELVKAFYGGYIHSCPKCGSFKVFSYVDEDYFSDMQRFKCDKCNHKWGRYDD